MALTQVRFQPFITVDKVFFLSLLRSCISLSTNEKSRVLNSMINLSQFQVNELILVFLDERKEFVRLSEKDDEKSCIQNLLTQTLAQWEIIEQKFEIPTLLTEDELLDAIEDFLQYRQVENPLSQENIPKWLCDDSSENENKEENEILNILIKSLDDKHEDEYDESNDDNHFDDQQDYDLFDDEDENDENDDNMTETTTQKFSLLEKMGRAYEFDKKLHEKPEQLKPLEIINKLKQVIFDQDIALKKITAILFYHHQSYLMWETEYKPHTNPPFNEFYQKEPLYLRQPPTLLIGKTGTGKTHLIKNVIQHFNLNLVVINSSTLVRTGIIGTSIDTIGKMIFESAGKDLSKAEFTVVFLDEFDKLFVHNEGYEANANLSIALQLLMIMEGSAPFPVEHSSQRERDEYPTYIDSSKMLFILGGSFGIHEKHLAKFAMGFHTKKRQKTLQEFDQTYLTHLGLPDELSGRIGQVICLNPINKKYLKDILLKSPNSPWQVLKNQIHLMNCEVILPNDVIETLIDNHQKDIDKFGVRGLYQAFSSLPCIHDFMIEATLAPNQIFYICLPD